MGAGCILQNIKMFGDLNKEAGVKALNAHLADNSYIEGFVPSQADAAVFDALKGKCPDRAACPHAERWFLHSKTFEGIPREKSKETCVNCQNLCFTGHQTMGR